MAESYVDECSSVDLYDNIAIPALRLAENDRRRSGSDIGYRRQVADTAIFVVHEVADHVGERHSSTQPKDGNSPPQSRILCLAGRTELDHAAAEMASQALEEHGIGAKVLPPIAASSGALGQLDLAGVEVVCLCYLHMEPQVFNYRTGDPGPVLKAGQCLAIEPMVNLGTEETREGRGPNKNLPPVHTADGKVSAHFEHTLIVTEGDPIITTRL